MKIKILIGSVIYVFTIAAAQICSTSPASTEGCQNTRIIRAVGIDANPMINGDGITRHYFYRAHPLYKYAMAASQQGLPIASNLWDRVQGLCALIYDPSHPFTKHAWKAAINNCQAERKNPPSTINFNCNNPVVDICWEANPARLAFEAEWEYLQARTQCFQNVTRACADPNSPECQQASTQCSSMEKNVSGICFASNPLLQKTVMNELKPGSDHLPLNSMASDAGACYAYCSSILDPIDMHQLAKIKVNANQQVPYLQISNDGGITFTQLIGI